MSCILIQYTTASPFGGFLTLFLTSSAREKNGGLWSTLAAFSALAILLGRNLASSFVFFDGGGGVPVGVALGCADAALEDLILLAGMRRRRAD